LGRESAGTKAGQTPFGDAFRAFSKKKMSIQNQLTRINNASLLGYKLPVFRKTKDCDYVEYYAYNPLVDKLHRKRIKLNNVPAKGRKAYANALIKRITDKLVSGWNPFIEQMSHSDMMLVESSFEEFKAYNERMYAEGTFRKQTYAAYKSYLVKLMDYCNSKNKITYLYQFDTRYCNAILDYVFLDLKYCARTRNNYLTFLNIFFAYFVEHGILNDNPARTIKKIPQRMLKKQREVIPLDVVRDIAEYLEENDKMFLLACYLLYYCFIRPQELCRLQIRNLQLMNHTIYIRGEQAKNRKDEYITLNEKVETFIRSLGLCQYPSDYYIFSRRLKPGEYEISPSRFGERWDKLRTKLGFSSTYQFYSLKDTGITELADNNVTNISIRDQARHSSLAITDVYTRHSAIKANEELRGFDGSL
jgi:integrase